MKLKISFLVIVILVIIVRLFCGIYEDNEFTNEGHFFIKHRPTWKWIFYSPQGMSDKKFEKLTPEEQVEQKYWNEFVVRKK